MNIKEDNKKEGKLSSRDKFLETKGYPLDYTDHRKNVSDMISLLASKMIILLRQNIGTDNFSIAKEGLGVFIKLHYDQIKKDSDLMSLMKESLTQFIAVDGISLIDSYQLLFHDNKFDNYEIPKDKLRQSLEQPKLPPLGAEDLINIENWVAANCRWTVIRNLNMDGKSVKIQKNKKKSIKFEVGQIVGARDQESKWWMARILYVFEDPNYPYPWYYVHFEGWKDLQNEWISSPFRIKNFNPRRDFLKR